MNRKEQIKVLLISECGRMSMKENDLSHCGRTEENLKDYCSDRIRLASAYVAREEEEEKRIEGGTVCYPLHVNMPVGASDDDWQEAREALLEVIADYRPDIIQCFGSEWPYGQIAADTEVPVIIHMMGFLNEYYPAIDMAIGFEEWRLNPPQNENPEPEPESETAGNAIKKLLRKIVKKTPEEPEAHTFIVRPETVNSETERRTMKANKYFLGRTDWDRDIVRHYSPGASYFHVAEFMKQQVYDAAGSWHYSFDGRLRLLSISSADERKGNEIILRAAKALKELNGPDFEWRVTCGSDALTRFELKTGIKHEDVNVKPIGFIETPQIIEEMQQADLFIHPSIIDNSPNSVCEAQLIGCPVIASNVGGLPQIVSHGETGFLYPYHEAHTLAFMILDLYREGETLEKLSANAVTEALRRHDPEEIANNLADVYEQVISKDKEEKNRKSNES